MPALMSLFGGMAQGRLQEIAAEDKQKADEGKIIAKAKADRDAKHQKHMLAVGQVVEAVVGDNPGTTPGQARALKIRLAGMPSSALSNVANLVFSPDKKYTFDKGKIRTRPDPKAIGKVGKEAGLYANYALSGGFPQFNETMEKYGVSVGDLTDAATDEQRKIMQHIIGTNIQQQRDKGVPLLQAVVNSAGVLHNAAKFKDSWLPFGDSVSIGSSMQGVPAPQSVQVTRGGGTRDWTVENLVSHGGRMWKWLGGPEGPHQNPEANNVNNWELTN